MKKEEIDKMTFEEAMNALSEIANEMNTNTLSIDDALARCEMGKLLYERCNAILDTAKQKIKNVEV